MLHNGAALLTFNTLHRFCSVICRPRDGAADNGAARILHEFLGLPGPCQAVQDNGLILMGCVLCDCMTCRCLRISSALRLKERRKDNLSFVSPYSRSMLCSLSSSLILRLLEVMTRVSSSRF